LVDLLAWGNRGDRGNTVVAQRFAFPQQGKDDVFVSHGDLRLMVESSGAMAPGRCYDQENIESPAYSLGGHETAGFCAVVFGRQPGKAGLLNRSEWDNTHSGSGVNTPAVLFSPLNLWSPVGVNPR